MRYYGSYATAVEAAVAVAKAKAAHAAKHEVEGAEEELVAEEDDSSSADILSPGQPQAEAFVGCFCDNPHAEPSNTDGIWVQCDSCERWCHGECAGVNSAAEAEVLEAFSCHPCSSREQVRLCTPRRSSGRTPSSSS
jgi:hypothetical protein